MPRYLLGLLVSVAAWAAEVTGSGIITTFAGADWVYPGDRLPALSAPLGRVRDVAFDPAGRPVFADFDNHVVLRLNDDGTLSVLAGSGLRGFSVDGVTARSAALNSPVSAAVDGQGNVFFCDQFNHRVRRISSDGVLTTVAGNGRAAFSGDGGPATVASLNTPSGLALDGSGVVYVLDRGNSRIRRVGTNGTITTFAGNGQFGTSGDGASATQAAIQPERIGIDTRGTLYIAQFSDHRVRAVSPSGIITTYAGTGERGFSGDGGPVAAAMIAFPTGVTGERDGSILIGDSNNVRIRRVGLNGIINTIAGGGLFGFGGDGGPALQASFRFPNSAASDPAGNLYIADYGNFRLRRVGVNGVIQTVAGNGSYRKVANDSPARRAFLYGPQGLAFDAGGNLLIADRIKSEVQRVTPNGTFRTVLGIGVGGCCGGEGIPAVTALAGNPEAVAVDRVGNVYVTSVSGGGLEVIRRITPDGLIRTFAGSTTGFSGDAGPALSAQFNTIQGLAFDPTGNLYVADAGNNRVRRVTPAGVVSTVAGNGTAGFSGDGGASVSAALRFPSAVAADPQGNIYIADSLNHRVRRVSAGGTITTIAGTGVATSTGDGGSADLATVNYPVALALDAPGNLFIAEQNGNRVRKITPSGVISTVAGVGRRAFSGEGGAAAGAALSSPSGLAVDAAGNLYIADTGNDRVRVVIAGPSPSILLSQKGLTFSITPGVAPAPQSFAVVNGGQGLLTWSAAASVASGSAQWLSIAPSSGRSDSGAPGPSVEIRVNPAGLAPGDYYGQIEVTAPGAPNSPQFVTVVLNVTPAGSTTGITALPTGLIFSAAAGGVNPAAQRFTVSSGSATANPVTASVSFPAGRPWFTLQPATGNVSATQPLGIEVRPNTSGFGAGVYEGNVTVSGGGSEQRLSLLLVIAPAATAASMARRAADGCTATRLLPLFTVLGTNFSAAASWPVPLEVRVVDDCGRAITDGAASAEFSNGDLPVLLRSLRDGRFAGTWQSRGGNAASVTITARATAPPNLTGTTQIAGGLRANSNPPPEVAANGVLNAASYSVGAPLAPGSLVSIFGQRIAAITQSATSLPLPLDLGGTTVSIAGRPLPLVFVSANQVNALLPDDIAINATHQVIARRGNAISTPEPLQTLTSQTGVFTKDLTGRGEGIIVVAYPDGSQAVAGRDNPVKAGDVIVIYSTGLGPVDPRVPVGIPAPAEPLSRTIDAVTVTIGGVEAPVFFSGLTPGFTGLYQINATVPPGVAAADSVQVIVTASGQVSPAVEIAVR